MSVDSGLGVHDWEPAGQWPFRVEELGVQVFLKKVGKPWQPLPTVLYVPSMRLPLFIIHFFIINHRSWGTFVENPHVYHIDVLHAFSIL